MTELERRLGEGPLRTRSLWAPERPEQGARNALKKRRRRVVLALELGAMCAAVALYFIGQRIFDHQSGHIAARAAPALAREKSESVRFADGSTAELSLPGATLRVTEDGRTRVVTELTGGARFDVVPNTERTFEIRAGDVRVRVLGTRFSVQRLQAGRVEVLVERGRVEVAWFGGSTILESGHGGVFPPATDTEDARGGQEPAVPSDSTSPATMHSAPNPMPSERDTPARLMQLADAARVGGRPAEAIALLRRVCDEYPADSRAPLAAFTLGRVLDDLGRSTEAARAFHRARVTWPNGPLAGDAYAREAEDLLRTGNTAEAKQVAEAYVTRYPRGRHVDAMKKLLVR
jgi:transmembrane sensor